MNDKLTLFHDSARLFWFLRDHTSSILYSLHYVCIDVREKAATIHVYNKGEDTRQTLTGRVYKMVKLRTY